MWGGRGVTWWTTITVASVVAVGMSGCGASGQSTGTTAQGSIFQQAAHDLKHADHNDSVNTVVIAADLRRLRAKCRENPVHLANEIYNSTVDLRKHGIMQTPQAVTSHLVRAVRGLSKAATPTNCGAILAAYLVLREQ